MIIKKLVLASKELALSCHIMLWLLPLFNEVAEKVMFSVMSDKGISRFNSMPTGFGQLVIQVACNPASYSN